MAIADLSIGCLATGAYCGELVVLEPVNDPGLASLLQQNLTLPLIFDNDILGRIDLEAEVTAEVIRLTDLLVQQGFLDAQIDVSGKGTEGDPLRMRPVLGPQYRIGGIRINQSAQPIDPVLRAALDNLILGYVGVTATDGALREVREKILLELQQASYADAVVTSEVLISDQEVGIADLLVFADPGNAFRFGRIEVEGSYRVDDSVAMGLASFRPGDAYSPTVIDDLRNALEQTGKFRRVRIEIEQDPSEAGLVNLRVILRDRAPADSGVTVGGYWIVVAIVTLVGLESVRANGQLAGRNLRGYVAVSYLVLFLLSFFAVAGRVLDLL